MNGKVVYNYSNRKETEKQIKLLSDEVLINEIVTNTYISASLTTLLQKEYIKRNLFTKENNLKLFNLFIDNYEEMIKNSTCIMRVDSLCDFLILENNSIFSINEEMFHYLLTNLNITDELVLAGLYRRFYYYFQTIIEDNEMSIQELNNFIINEKGETTELSRYCAASWLYTSIKSLSMFYSIFNYLNLDVAKELIEIYVDKSYRYNINKEKLLKINKETIIDNNRRNELEVTIKSIFMEKKLKK